MLNQKGRSTKGFHFFSILIILLGCVPYQQQIYERQLALLNSSKPCKIINNNTLYKNQLDFEQHNIESGQRITLLSILPEDIDHLYNHIFLVDDQLVIPVSAYKEVHMQSEYMMVWDGDYVIDKMNNYHFNLIFIESRPDEILWSNTRENKYPITMYYSFDLSRYKYPGTDTLKINLLGLDETIDYIY